MTKQDCIVSDTSSHCKLVLWEGNVGTLKVGTSYNFSKVRVKKYNSTTFLSFTIETVWDAIEDIRNTIPISQCELLQPQYERVIDGEIISVIYDEHQKCPVCNFRMTLAYNDIYECTKCKSKCKHSKAKKYAYAKLFLQDSDGSSYNVTMFNNVLSSLNLQEAHSIEEQLLSIDSIKVQVNSNNVVTAIIQ